MAIDRSPSLLPRTRGLRLRHGASRRDGRLSPPRLLGVCSRAAMRSRCSGVSGGNESTTVRTCSASTVVACSRVAGSVVLGADPSAVRMGCFWEGGSDLGESVMWISGAVAVGRVCLALLCVPGVLSRCFEWFGWPVRYVFLFSGKIVVWLEGFPACLGLRQWARNTRTHQPVNQSARVAAWESISLVAARSTAARMSVVR